MESRDLKGTTRLVGGLEDDGPSPNTRGSNALWLLVETPDGCDYETGTYWDDDALLFTLRYEGWDEGMVFLNKRTGERRRVLNGKFVTEQKS